MIEQQSLELVAGVGISGDRYATQKGHYSDRPEPGRQITLFEIETLEALKRDHGIELSPDEHRRNASVRAVPLNHLVGRRFRFGETVLQGTRLSTPCKYLDDLSGKKLLKALLNRSGLNCIIVKGGVVHVGDVVGEIPANRFSEFMP